MRLLDLPGLREQVLEDVAVSRFDADAATVERAERLECRYAQVLLLERAPGFHQHDHHIGEAHGIERVGHRQFFQRLSDPGATPAADETYLGVFVRIENERYRTDSAHFEIGATVPLIPADSCPAMSQ